MTIEAMKQALADLEGVFADTMAAQKSLDSARAHIRAAITQAEQAGDDTARLDWLEKHIRYARAFYGPDKAKSLYFDADFADGTLRAAIDSARGTRGAGEV